MRAVLTAFITIAFGISACSEQAEIDSETRSVATTRSPLTGTELSQAQQAAAKGDIASDMALAFHYSDIGDDDQSSFHFDRCLKGEHPECLIQQSSHLIDDAMNSQMPREKRGELFREALNYTDRAIASEKYRSTSRPEDYKAQREAIIRELSALGSK